MGSACCSASHAALPVDETLLLDKSDATTQGKNDDKTKSEANQPNCQPEEGIITVGTDNGDTPGSVDAANIKPNNKAAVENELDEKGNEHVSETGMEEPDADGSTDDNYVRTVPLEDPSPDDFPYPPGYEPLLPTQIVGTYSTHGLMPQPWGLPPVKVNQDYGTVLYPCTAKDRVFFTVCDGHGRNGTRASQIAAHAINENLERELVKVGSDPGQQIDQLLTSSFDSAHETLATIAVDDEFDASGTTAVAVLVCGHDLWIGNVGDSRALVVQSDGGTVALTSDHKVNDPKEKERILAQGGTITEEENEAARVVCNSHEGSRFALGMSRSIGDLRFASSGVIHSADVSHHKIHESDQWLIMATDGIWEFIENQEAVDIVKSSWEQHKDATMACRALIARAKDLWFEIEGDYRDDITVTIVDLHGMLTYIQERQMAPNTPSPGPLASPSSPKFMAIDEDESAEYEAQLTENMANASEEYEAQVTDNLPAASSTVNTASTTLDNDASSFIKRRGSILSTSGQGNTISVQDLQLAQFATRRLSASPEIDMRLWPADSSEM